MTPDVAMTINRDPWPKAPGETPRETTARKRQLQSMLARFINGDKLRPNIHVKVLQPTEAAFSDLLEFRSGPPDPQTRLFAMGYEPSVWICTGFHLREDLGDKGDPRWAAAAKASKDAWSGLFSNRMPLKAPYPCDTIAKLQVLLDV